jgi:hypothetical protein
MSARLRFFTDTALLLGLCAVLYFPYLGAAPFYNKGEPREAMAVQDIVLRGEWLVPLKRATDVPSKPPLFHWSAAALYRVTGQLDEATVRLPSALYATAGVFLVYLLARRLFGAEAGFLAGAILATTMIYQDQALDARVDMTLCFFITLSLALFYFIYAGMVSHPAWYYVFFAVTGIATLAKGPLGILLPALVAGSFVVLKGRWGVLRKFILHPGVLLMLILGAGWYVVAVTRGSDEFFDRQIIQENLRRFVGGSGHTHPVYYYVPYLFAQGLPWALLLPVTLWDVFKTRSLRDEHRLFFKLWFVAMLIFFSISLGKRPVYILPLYPALAILMALWMIDYDGVDGPRSYYYRAVAVFAAFTGALVLLPLLGELWSHNPASLFRPIESLLKPKDRANFALVSRSFVNLGAPFLAAALASALLWFSLARCLWSRRLRAAALRLVLIAVTGSLIVRALVVPEIAAAKSYRQFMLEVNRRVARDQELYIYRNSFNSDQVVFYRGEPVSVLNPDPAEFAAKVGSGSTFVIMVERDWRALEKLGKSLPPPLVTGTGTGPDGEGRLVLVRASRPE